MSEDPYPSVECSLDQIAETIADVHEILSAPSEGVLSDAAFLDECAMRAMAGLIARPIGALDSGDPSCSGPAYRAVVLAFEIARGMLAERKRMQAAEEKRRAMNGVAPPPAPIEFDLDDWGGHANRVSQDGRMFTINGVPHTLYDVSGGETTWDGRPLLTMKFRREEK